MAYSIDFRKRAVEYKREGHSQKEIKEVFRVAVSTVNKCEKLLVEKGSLEPAYPKTRIGKIDYAELAKGVKEQPDKYQRERAEKYNCTRQAIGYALKKLKITHKKNIHV